MSRRIEQTQRYRLVPLHEILIKQDAKPDPLVRRKSAIPGDLYSYLKPGYIVKVQAEVVGKDKPAAEAFWVILTFVNAGNFKGLINNRLVRWCRKFYE